VSVISFGLTGVVHGHENEDGCVIDGTGGVKPISHDKVTQVYHDEMICHAHARSWNVIAGDPSDGGRETYRYSEI